MKKIILCLMAMATLTACQNDDTDFSAYTNGETTTSTTSTIYITYSGTAVTVSGDSKGYVTTSGADVTVNTGTDTDSLLLVLSGTTTDGSLLVYREKKFGIQLNGVNITNQDGPAINNQCSKSLYMVVADGTTNTLADGTAYDESVSYQQKGLGNAHRDRQYQERDSLRRLYRRQRVAHHHRHHVDRQQHQGERRHLD